MVSGGLQSDQQVNNLLDQIKDLQERLSQLERFALTSQDIKANKIILGEGPWSINDIDNGSLTLQESGITVSERIEAEPGQVAQTIYSKGGDARWVIRCTNAAETGSDAGSDLEIISRHDDGTYYLTPIKIWRDTGLIKLGTNCEVHTVPWTDYSSTSTITGWSSRTETRIYYKKLGNLVFVNYRLVGTSNSTSTNFTVPYNGVVASWLHMCVGRDNGAALYDGPYCTISTTGFVTFVKGIGYSTTAWTASGDKAVYGSLWYEAA